MLSALLLIVRDARLDVSSWAIAVPGLADPLASTGHRLLNASTDRLIALLAQRK